ncbi:MAG TPA: hypothetical protein VMP08_10635 [Anaerolineae bacterium]|nr:hypothetical protein [Anaerolineae bacterium]
MERSCSPRRRIPIEHRRLPGRPRMTSLAYSAIARWLSLTNPLFPLTLLIGSQPMIGILETIDAP